MADEQGLPEASGRQSARGLKLHHLRPAPGAHKAKTRVGRGEASKGKTAGRGTKGTKARTTMRLGFEGGQMPLNRRVPKLKGFKNPFRVEYQVVNVEKLAELFPQGGAVTPVDRHRVGVWEAADRAPTRRMNRRAGVWRRDGRVAPWGYSTPQSFLNWAS